jgi:hypothetical protein
MSSGISLLPAAALAVLLIGAALLIGSCSDPAAPPTPPDVKGKPADMAAYLGGLPSWEVFSPRQDDTEPLPVGPPLAHDTVTMDVQKVDPDGTLKLLPDRRYQRRSPR